MIFEQGDIVLVDFDPTKGHEPQKRRPALVVSNSDFNISTTMTIVCPITSAQNSFFLHLSLPDDSETNGLVVTEQVRAIDLAARGAKKIGHISDSELEPFLICLKSFF